MKKDWKMELLNSESAQQVKGGGTCINTDLITCTPTQVFQGGGGDCVIQYVNPDPCIESDTIVCGIDIPCMIGKDMIIHNDTEEPALSPK